MKKTKGLLTPAEKEVAYRNKKIIILCIVLIISMVINAIYIFNMRTSIPKYKIVKTEDSISDESDIASDAYDDQSTEAATAKDKALAEAYDEARVVTFKEGSIFHIDVCSRNKGYKIELRSEEMFFSTSGSDMVSCKFVKEKFDGILDIINDAELRELTIKSYPNENGKLIDYNPDEYLIIYSDSGLYKIYPPDNWDSIIDYCEELYRVASE